MPYDASGNWIPGGSANITAGGGYAGGTGQGDLGLGGYSGSIYKPQSGDFANPQDAQNRDLLAQYFNMLGGRTAPEASAAQLGKVTTTDAASAGAGATYGGATIDTGESEEARKYQLGLMGQLQNETEGKGPSLATETMKQGLAANLQQQAGLAGAMGGGSNPALAMRNLQMSAAGQNQQLLGQAGLARLQEQMAAQQQLAGLSSGVRSQDIGVAEQQAGLTQQAGMFSAGQQNQFSLANAGFQQQANLANMGAYNQSTLMQGQMDQQTALANLQAKLGLLGMNQQGQTWALGQTLGMSEADRQAAMQYEQMMQSGSIAQQQMNAQQYADKSAAQRQIVGGLMSGIAGGMMSDKHSKMEIESESSLGGVGGSTLEDGAAMKQYYPDWVKLSPPDAKTEFLNESSIDDPGFGTTPDEQNYDNAIQKADYEQSIWNPDTRAPVTDDPTVSAIKEELASQSPEESGTARSTYMPPWLGRAPKQTDIQKWYANAQPDIAATNAAMAKLNASIPEDVEGEAVDEERKNRQKLYEKALAGDGASKPSNPNSSGNDAGSNALGSVIGGGIAMSDENAKKAVSAEGKGASKNLLDPIEPYSYRYKNPSQPGAAPGRQLGVMAQDVERSPYASDAVIDTDQGKMIDYSRLGPPMLAAMSDLNKRTTLLEKMLAKRKAG